MVALTCAGRMFGTVCWSSFLGGVLLHVKFSSIGVLKNISEVESVMDLHDSRVAVKRTGIYWQRRSFRRKSYIHCMNSRHSVIMKLHANEIFIYLKSMCFGQVLCLRIISERKVDNRYVENGFPVIFLGGLVALFPLKTMRRKILETEIWSEGYHLLPPGMCNLSIHMNRFFKD